MATLDAFVKNIVRRPKERHDGLGDNFRYSGGKAIIISPKGEVTAVGLGIFNCILECYDKPADPSDSNTLKMVLNTHRKTDIFADQFVHSMAVSAGIVQWKPVDNYEKIKDATEDLHSKYMLLKEALGDKGSGKYLVQIETTTKKIKDAKSPEKMMRYIFSESSELGFLINYISGWASNNWFIDLPDEYEVVAKAFQTLRESCRTSKYVMSVPNNMKDNQYLHSVSHVDGVSIDRSSIIIVDYAKELKALSKLGWDDRNVIYRGPLSKKTRATVDKLRTNNFVICENIKGPNQYRQWLKKHSE